MAIVQRALRLIGAHQTLLVACTRCANMHRPPIVCGPLYSKVLLVGQAPGDKEPALGRPFAWTAGKQLFKWFAPLGLNEAEFRARVYMAAVCRCFPGKNPKGGDRVPTPEEVSNCRPWLAREIALLEPALILPVGRVAIEQFLPPRPLVEQIGSLHVVHHGKVRSDVIPLPHPSGASTWPRAEPGKDAHSASPRLHRGALGVARVARLMAHLFLPTRLDGSCWICQISGAGRVRAPERGDDADAPIPQK